MQLQPQSIVPDRDRLASLYQQCAPRILDYIYRHVSSAQDAEDLLIDVFLAALESATFATLTEQNQQAWLWRVAHHKVVDVYRRTQNIQRLPLKESDIQLTEDIIANPEHLSIQREDTNNLALLIEQLSPFQQHVIYLRFGENLRCTQIATQTGKRESSIRSLLSRALGTLRKNYQEQLKGGNDNGTTT